MSPTFQGSTGLYLVVLEMDLIGDRHHTSCLLGGDMVEHARASGQFGMQECDVAQAVALSWRLFDGDLLVAQDGPAHTCGAEPLAVLQTGSRRVERELGTFRLERSHSYRLEARATNGGQILSSAHPIVKVRLHPWDAKDGVGRLLLNFLITATAGLFGLCWLIGAAWPRLKPDQKRS
jgi:hypothetical protein